MHSKQNHNMIWIRLGEQTRWPVVVFGKRLRNDATQKNEVIAGGFRLEDRMQRKYSNKMIYSVAPVVTHNTVRAGFSIAGLFS